MTRPGGVPELDLLPRVLEQLVGGGDLLVLLVPVLVIRSGLGLPPLPAGREEHVLELIEEGPEGSLEVTLDLLGDAVPDLTEAEDLPLSLLDAVQYLSPVGDAAVVQPEGDEVALDLGLLLVGFAGHVLDDGDNVVPAVTLQRGKEQAVILLGPVGEALGKETIPLGLLSRTQVQLVQLGLELLGLLDQLLGALTGRQIVLSIVSRGRILGPHAQFRNGFELNLLLMG
mmetsp:Transcript_14522/g.42535  ORF Transcript_14522/g.42535 Transcript_14522/m.42535 type:complete len:228 (+) Transcript_14522:521-1204(+)